MAESTVAGRLAAFVHGLRFQDLPQRVVDKVGVIVLHNLGVAVAGHRAVRDIWQAVRHRKVAGPGAATLMVEGLTLSAADAAFANAMLIHARAQDDVHAAASTHVGCTVLPAALAVAEAFGRSGQEFVTALVAGYEVACAVGKVGARLSTPRGFRASGVYGPLGAAAAAAKLMGLSQEQIQNAIAIAASMSAGLNQTWVDGSHEWRIQVGSAARSGIYAAELAAAGAVGARHAFEGPVGFFQAIVGDRGLAAECGHDLGRTWETLAVTFKPYPVCAILQAPVTTLLRMRAQHSLRPEQVQRVTLYLHPYDAAYPGTDAPGPFADVGATLMSAQFCLAVALVRGEVRLHHLYEFDQPDYARLWPRIVVSPDPGVSQNSCRIQVETTDGRVLTDQLLAGPQTFNFTPEEEKELVRGLLPETPLTAEALERLIDASLAVQQLPSLKPLVAATCA